MTELDRLYAAMEAGGDAAGMAFYRALADAELLVLLDREAVDEVVSPRVFELPEGPVLLAFDTEERLAAFADRALPYAALPGRVIAAQMAGQGLSLGLNLGSGGTSEVILPPQALDWLMTMLDQAAPQEVEAQIAGFTAPNVPQSVLDALATALKGVPKALLARAIHKNGREGMMLAVTGAPRAAEGKIARAVTESLAFSGMDAAEIDLSFADEASPLVAALAQVALIFEGEAAPFEAAPVAPTAPGMDPSRPPRLK